MKKILFLIGLMFIFITSFAQQQKAFTIIKMIGGSPDIDTIQVNYVLCADIPRDSVTRWGAYIFAGDSVSLNNIKSRALVEIIRVTETGQIHWAELDVVIPAARRNVMNTWLSNNSFPTIPAGWTYKQCVIWMYKRISDKYDIDLNDIMEKQ